MKPIVSLVVSILLPVVAASCPASSQQATQHSTEGLVHIRTEFKFAVNAPFEETGALFGANEERKWSEGWNPQFVFPLPAHDEAGMVFKVSHGQRSSVWVNTAFDLANGHIQYVYVLEDAMTTLIDIRLTRAGDQKTSVVVAYERTALMPEANEHVQHFAKADVAAAKEWSDAINGYFAKGRANPAPAAK